jgi:ABC-type phosphate transport system substrate-binding protein
VICLYCAILFFHSPSSSAAPPAGADSNNVVVIIQKGSVPSTPVSRYVLAAIFGMRLTSWPDGTATKVFVLPDDNRVHSQFCKQVLHVFPHQLRTAWDRLVYSGTGQSPEIVGSEKEMKARVAATPGAIGYLTKETLDDSVAILPVE